MAQRFIVHLPTTPMMDVEQWLPLRFSQQMDIHQVARKRGLTRDTGEMGSRSGGSHMATTRGSAINQEVAMLAALRTKGIRTDEPRREGDSPRSTHPPPKLRGLDRATMPPLAYPQP